MKCTGHQNPVVLEGVGIGVDDLRAYRSWLCLPDGSVIFTSRAGSPRHKNEFRERDLLKMITKAQRKVAKKAALTGKDLFKTGAKLAALDAAWPSRRSKPSTRTLSGYKELLSARSPFKEWASRRLEEACELDLKRALASSDKGKLLRLLRFYRNHPLCVERLEAALEQLR